MQQMFTIGYEGADLDSVLSEMAASSVEVLVDVRAVAVSRRKGFSKGALSDAVKAAGMQYLHIRDLGDPKPGREAARAGDLASFRKIYGDHLRTPACTVALAELDALSRRKVVCLLCYEHDATGCHRKIISDKLAVARPLRVEHLRPPPRAKLPSRTLYDPDQGGSARWA